MSDLLCKVGQSGFFFFNLKFSDLFQKLFAFFFFFFLNIYLGRISLKISQKMANFT